MEKPLSVAITGYAFMVQHNTFRGPFLYNAHSSTSTNKRQDFMKFRLSSYIFN